MLYVDDGAAIGLVDFYEGFVKRVEVESFLAFGENLLVARIVSNYVVVSCHNLFSLRKGSGHERDAVLVRCAWYILGIHLYGLEPLRELPQLFFG